MITKILFFIMLPTALVAMDQTEQENNTSCMPLSPRSLAKSAALLSKLKRSGSDSPERCSPDGVRRASENDLRLAALIAQKDMLQRNESSCAEIEEKIRELQKEKEERALAKKREQEILTGEAVRLKKVPSRRAIQQRKSVQDLFDSSNQSSPDAH